MSIAIELLKKSVQHGVITKEEMFKIIEQAELKNGINPLESVWYIDERHEGYNANYLALTDEMYNKILQLKVALKLEKYFKPNTVKILTKIYDATTISEKVWEEIEKVYYMSDTQKQLGRLKSIDIVSEVQKLYDFLKNYQHEIIEYTTGKKDTIRSFFETFENFKDSSDMLRKITKLRLLFCILDYLDDNNTLCKKHNKKPYNALIRYYKAYYV